MKKNAYFIVFIFTIIFIIIEFSALQFMLKTTRLFPVTEITLKIESNNIDDYELPAKITEESILELQKAISDVSLNNNQDVLLEAFDKERTFYINFITIISIVLSIFGIVPVVYGFFEKNENAKLREELEKLKDEYGNRLDKIKQKSVFDWFSDKTNALDSNYNLIFDDSTSVKDENDFYKFIIYYFIKTTNEINTELLNENNLHTLAIEMSNFMVAIISYSSKRYSESFIKDSNSVKYSIQHNEIFNNMFIHLQTLLSEDQFNTLINIMKNLPNSEFDYTGF